MKKVKVSQNNNVVVGQIWQDNDKRMVEVGSDRRLVVKAVDHESAWCSIQTRKDDGKFYFNGRSTRIALFRFVPSSTGYRLMEDEA